MDILAKETFTDPGMKFMEAGNPWLDTKEPGETSP